MRYTRAEWAQIGPCETGADQRLINPHRGRIAFRILRAENDDVDQPLKSLRGYRPRAHACGVFGDDRVCQRAEHCASGAEIMRGQGAGVPGSFARFVERQFVETPFGDNPLGGFQNGALSRLSPRCLGLAIAGDEGIFP